VTQETGLSSVAYARNALHQRFVLEFEGQLRARYNLVFLETVGVLGGAKLRRDIERELGHPRYAPDGWASVRDAILIFDRAVRAGVSVEQMGELVMPTYKQANPDVFRGRSITDAFEILEKGYRQDTSYGGVSPGLKTGRDHASVFRRNSVFPCLYFVGVIRGLLGLFGVQGTIGEVECQWQGAPSCRFDARWGQQKSAA
jgi:hypothetical protein